jgi:hypothetical protein
MPDKGREKTDLEEAFLRDHRQLTRQLARTLAALERGDLADAVKIADQLDQAAGSHIHFEETVLYPAVAKVNGAEFVKQLLREHKRGKAAVARLLKHGKAFPRDELPMLIEAFHVAVNHASSCGTLLSHLSAASDCEQSRMLDELRVLEYEQVRWTELPALQKQLKQTT